jgi:hypothetical protein
MQVGDLVKYWKDNTFGIITKFNGNYYTVLFADCEVSYITLDELEAACK